MTEQMSITLEPPATAMQIPFKVFGLQRTGTNLMVALMTRNFHVHSLEMGAEWKHGPVRRTERMWNDSLARFVLCVRNPYAWLYSCYRYLRRANGSDRTVAPQFKRDPSVSFEEFVITPTYTYASGVHRWNEMYARWLRELPEDRTAVVRQDDQLEHQISVLKAVEAKLGVRRRNRELQPIDRRVDVGAHLHGSFERDQKYYLNREYMAEYSPALLEKVNQLLDSEVLDTFGYSRERWSLAEREVHGITLFIRPTTSDAGDARAVTFDPYGFETIKATGHQIKTYVDVGAHIGATAIFAKRIWPDCKVLCYEPCPENVRMLRINLRRFGEDAAICGAAVTDSAGIAHLAPALQQEYRPYPSGGGVVESRGDNKVTTVGLEDAVQKCGEIDVLKIGCPDSLRQILDRAIATGLLKKVRWICGRFPSDADFRQWLTDRLNGRRALRTEGKKRMGYFVIEPEK